MSQLKAAQELLFTSKDAPPPKKKGETINKGELILKGCKTVSFIKNKELSIDIGL